VGEFIVVGEFVIAYIRACLPGDNISWVPQDFHRHLSLSNTRYLYIPISPAHFEV